MGISRFPEGSGGPLIIPFTGFILGLLVLFPPWGNRYPLSALTGHPHTDTLEHLWGLWWNGESLGRGEGFPVRSEISHYPEGATLFFIDPLNSVAALPFTLAGNPVAGYNFALLFNLILAFAGASFLARHLTSSTLPSIMAGAIYAFSPYMLSIVHNGVTELTSTGYLPLSLLFTMRFCTRGRVGNFLLSLLFTILSLFSSFYHALFTVSFLLLFLFYQIVTRGLIASFTETSRNSRERPFRFHFALRFLLPLLLSLILYLPYLSFFHRTMQKEDSVLYEKSFFVKGAASPSSAVDVLGLFIPFNPGGERTISPPESEFLHVTYLTLTPIILLVLFWKKGGRGLRGAGFWRLSFLVYIVLSFGPYLYIMGDYLTIHGEKVPLPFLLFFRFVPFVGYINYPYRFVLPALLSLGILTASILKGMKVYGRGAYRVLTLLLPTLFLTESLFLSPAVYPIPYTEIKVPPVYHRIGEMEGDFAILDFPPYLGKEYEFYTVFQMVHRKRVPYGVNIFLSGKLQGNPFVRYALLLVTSDDLPTIPEEDIREGLIELRRFGFRFLLLHTHLVPEERRARVRAFFDDRIGKGREYEGGIVLYEISLPPFAAPQSPRAPRDEPSLRETPTQGIPPSL